MGEKERERGRERKGEGERGERKVEVQTPARLTFVYRRVIVSEKHRNQKIGKKGKKQRRDERGKFYSRKKTFITSYVWKDRVGKKKPGK